MATKFVTNIDLNQTQILNGRLEALASDPGSGNFEGRLIYNTTEDVSETVKKLAKESYERDLKEFDKQWGKGGIPTLVRDKI